MTEKNVLRIIKMAKVIRRKKLDLSGKGLTSLPPEIGQLTSLEVLDLGNNQLSVLPLEIGQLINLTSLHINNNQLTELPSEIGQLTGLVIFVLGGIWTSSGGGEYHDSDDISYNRFAELPIEITKLINLEHQNGEGD